MTRNSSSNLSSLLKSSFSPHWITVKWFTKGWSFFIQQELAVLVLLSALAIVVILLLGYPLIYSLVCLFIIIMVRRILAGGICISDKRLDGQTIVITGCNIGIGRETARALSKRGAKIIMACRNLEAAEKTACEIRAQTGGEVVVMKLDLASLTSVRTFAEQLKSKESRIHMLINNAGVMLRHYTKTEDGFEMQMGTNYLGHFLLTRLLLPLLTHSEPARIINLSALVHTSGRISFDDFNCEKNSNYTTAYSNSKLAMLLFTRQLAQQLQGTNIQVFAVHPGVVQSSIGRHTLWNWLQSSGLASVYFKTTAEGAQTTLYCALEAKQEAPYYYSDCALGSPSSAAHDDDTAKKLWQVSEEMVGLTK